MPLAFVPATVRCRASQSPKTPKTAKTARTQASAPTLTCFLFRTDRDVAVGCQKTVDVQVGTAESSAATPTSPVGNAEASDADGRVPQISADQLRLVTDLAPIGIFQTDQRNKYVYTNPRWWQRSRESAGIRPMEVLWIPSSHRSFVPTS